MTLLRLRSDGPQWPYSVARFKQDEPSLSISDNPHPGELATYAALDPPIRVFQVADVPPPEIDARTQRLLPVGVEQVGGAWRQVWTWRDATEQEIEEYDATNQPPPPPPNWTAYREGLRDPRYVNIVAAALESTPKAKYGAMSIPAALSSFEYQGQHTDYLDCILYILEGSALPVAEKTELAAELLALMAQCNLPGPFITELVNKLAPQLSSP